MDIRYLDRLFSLCRESIVSFSITAGMEPTVPIGKRFSGDNELLNSRESENRSGQRWPDVHTIHNQPKMIEYDDPAKQIAGYKIVNAGADR